MRYKKVLLTIPNFNWIKRDARTLWKIQPYGICLMASALKNDYEVNIIDGNFRDIPQDEFAGILKRIKPDVVGISLLTDEYAEAGHIAARLVKNNLPGAMTVLGGVYPTTQWDNINDENIDYIFRGEGELAFKDLLDMLNGRVSSVKNGKIVKNKFGKNVITARAIEDLDRLALPSYELVDYEKYTLDVPRESIDGPIDFPGGRIITSRGCPMDCVFCQVKEIAGRKLRTRSPENVIKEIEYLIKNYGIKSLIFDDDNLLLDKARAIRIFKAMIEKKYNLKWKTLATATYCLDEELLDLMKESGCEFMNLAIESGSPRVLKEIINKPIDLGHAKRMVSYSKKIGINVSVNFVVGFIGETWDEIRKTVDFAEEINADYMKLYFANPLPGSRLHKLAKEKGYLLSEKPDKWWFMGRIKTEEFSPVGLAILRVFEWDRINFKTPAKKEKIARLMNVSIKRLDEIRKDSIQKTLGIVKDYLADLQNY
jgi:radical SAM superfamily enzyme YgiQ (UPF0313 family)